ncbi:hypothetical protein C1637_06585 [Chryseobacterium lactis]|uniref:HTH luxR-type domain-containing protein n=1 Tax=Chryseobacterium lactis TaxID=1241981 RepID=A0A3G6RKV0_CHRLC|nr:LuxR C-terminal-related transcriptional regulator [Chryseobacterium lactis]AZA84500.1 hypothetical protein EG342_22555 [Chryseobacterium lactis]AZB04888.1 hypothetical protein EG341_13435 [Chryseobacterium lactis]PNW14619.1 hypothetical protein C1637_06585 [Chryseobacterium lactis]
MNCIHEIRLQKHKILLLLFTTIFFVSCHKKADINELDNALLQKNERLRLEGKDTELIALNNEVIEHAKQSGYQKGEALGYINLANMYATMGKYKISQKYLKSASGIANRLNDNFLYAKLYHEYGQLNYVTGLDNTALSYNAKAIYYGKQLEKKDWLLGNMYMQRADFIFSINKDSALIYLHKGFSTDPSALNSSILGNYYLSKSPNIDSANFYTTKALTLLKRSEYGTARQGIIYYLYADFLFERKDYEKALEYYKKSTEILIKTKRINKLPGIYQQTALTYQKLNNKEKEKEYSAKAEQLSKTLENSGTEAIDLSLTELIDQKEKQNINTIFIFASAIALILGTSLLLYMRKSKQNNPRLKSYTEELFTKDQISKENFTELLELAKNNDLTFIKRFEEINPFLFQNILKINPQLTKSELSLCAMIWLGFSSKNIADYTFIQHRSVQTKKGRLRKKLNIPSETDLYSFFTSL